MRPIPQFRADLDEYPELRTLASQALSRIAELMGIHGIAEIHRLHKTGVFDHPYTKDVVTPIGLQVIPDTVDAAQHAIGKALLDYLETIGISGLALADITNADVQAISSIWSPTKPQCAVNQQQEPDKPAPKPEEAANKPDETNGQDEPTGDKQHDENSETKEPQQGE